VTRSSVSDGTLFGLRPGAWAPNNGNSNEVFLKILSRQRGLNFELGAEYQYNNGGYLLLGKILERASGQTLGAFADANIFKPLDMTDAYSIRRRSRTTPGAERQPKPIPIPGVTLEFSPAEAGRPQAWHIIDGGGQRLLELQLVKFDISKVDLESFAGECRSDELDVTYTVAIGSRESHCAGLPTFSPVFTSKHGTIPS
jgi:CubicO group peptidase (beta-lactamase class C family)